MLLLGLKPASSQRSASMFWSENDEISPSRASRDKKDDCFCVLHSRIMK